MHSLGFFEKSQFIEKTMWKAKEDTKAGYPHLFVPPSDNVEGNIIFSYLESMFIFEFKYLSSCIVFVPRVKLLACSPFEDEWSQGGHIVTL